MSEENPRSPWDYGVGNPGRSKHRGPLPENQDIKLAQLVLETGGQKLTVTEVTSYFREQAERGKCYSSGTEIEDSEPQKALQRGGAGEGRNSLGKV